MAEDTLDNAVRTSFTVALLITGSIGQAEAAVMKGMASLDTAEASGTALLLGAVRAAIPPLGKIAHQRAEELEVAESILPLELRRVLYLAAQLRYCFVCRFLALLNRETVALLIHLNVDEVDALTCAALRELASITRNEPIFQEGARGAMAAAAMRSRLLQTVH